MIDILIILGLIFVIFGGLLSLKFKYGNHKKWWVPLAIAGSVFVVIIILVAIVTMVLFTTTLCV